MNLPRIAALLRELADELEAETPANDVDAPRPRAKRLPWSPSPVKPTGKCVPTELDRARARAIVRRHYGA